jgi:hypothetical protein
VTPFLAVSLVCASVQLPSAVAFAAPAAEADPLEQAEELWKQGKIKFETADYSDALDLWKQAYALLPDGQDAQVIRHALVYNISEAYLKAYEVNRDPKLLRKAKVLLEDYLQQHEALYGDEPDAVKEREEVNVRLGEVDAKIAESEAKGEGSTGGGGGGDDQSDDEEEKDEGPKTPRQLREEEIKNDPELFGEYNKANRRIVGGAVMLGIGLIPGITAALTWNGYVNVKNDQDLCDQGLEPVGLRTCDTLRPGAWLGTSIALSVVAVGLFAGGGALLGIGVKKRKAMLDVPPSSLGPQGEGGDEGEAGADEEAVDETPAEPETPQAFISPWANPQGGGATLTIRF